MSELKAFNCVESDLQEFCEPRLVYLKSEADKVIAELEQQIEILQKDKKIIQDLYKGERNDCRIWAARAIHNKYKRCLAMSRWCEIGAQFQHGLVIRFDNPYYIKRAEWLEKWRNRYREIAEKFKEAK